MPESDQQYALLLQFFLKDGGLGLDLMFVFLREDEQIAYIRTRRISCYSLGV